MNTKQTERFITGTPTPEQAKAIAREAFIYGFPFVEMYKSLYKQAIDKGSSEFRAPFNQIGHARGVATPDDAMFVTPNSDTPYSYAWLDLRTEPIVITMPKIEKARYYSAQLIDLQTFNFAYLGTRAYGNDGGDFLITGPGWNGEKPDSVKAVIPCETELCYSLFRTQLFNLNDIKTVERIQDGYRVRPLSTYLGQPALPAAPDVNWPALSADMTEGPALFTYLNFLLQFFPTHPSEEELMARFAILGIGAGKPFALDKVSPDVKQAVEVGIAEVWKVDFAGLMVQLNAGAINSGDAFGTREFLKNNYPLRFIGAKLGIFANSRDEAFYPTYFLDADNHKLDATTGDYELHFAKGQLPPTEAFWSLTMYDGKSQLLVANPLKRYLLNSTMLDSFKYSEDGSLTIYISKNSPGADQESNWLPAPDGPFYCILRLYIPKPEVFNGQWKLPKMRLAEKT